MFIPQFLVKLGDESEKNKAWIDSLPLLINRLKEEWSLEFGSLYVENVSCSFVLNCVISGKDKAVFKIGIPHEEALSEIDGLRLLNGSPTVKLLKFDTETNAMLLERCVPGVHLNTLEEPIQDKVICNLIQEVWNTEFSVENFRPLEQMVSQWNEETTKGLDGYPDPYLAEQGCKLKEALIESTDESVLLVTDLHAGNVLSAQRKDWLVIDIKPYFGDRAYDLTQHLLNCKGRLRSNPIDTVNRVADLAGVSRLRLREWLFARLASESGGVNQELALSLRL